MKNVASYIKNLGKSVAYSAIDEIKNQAPATSEFLLTNSELFKEVYSEIRQYKTAFKRVNDAVKSNKVYEAAEYGYKNILDSIKTGEFYSKKRSEEAAIKGGGDLMDFGTDDFEIDESGWGSVDNIPEGDQYVADKIETATKESADMISTTMARTGKYIVDSQKMSTNILYSQNLNLMSGLRNTIAEMGGSLKQSSDAQGKIMETHAKNALTFFTESTKLDQERNAILREMVEMQRNTYNALNKKEDENKNKKLSYSDIADSNGMPDIKQYGQNVKRNVKNVMSNSGIGMFTDGNDSMNILMSLVDNPLKLLPDTLIKAMLPATVGLAAKNLDKTLAGIFGTAIAKLNGMSKGDNPILKKIGEIFGIRSSDKSSLDTNKYEKGAVAFDGIVRKSIVEVIPTYLAKIESLLSGKEEKSYDYANGKWIKTHTTKTDFENMKKSKVTSSTAELRDYTNKFTDSLSFDKKDKDNLMKEVENVFTYIYNNGGDFNPRDRKLYQKMSGVSEEGYLLFLKMWKNIPRNVRMAMGGNVLQARAGYSKEVERLESNGDSVFNRQFNNSAVDEYVKKDKYGNITDTNGALGMGITKALDDKGNNMFFYLQNMYKELMLIRNYGTGLGGGTSITPTGSMRMPTHDDMDIKNNSTISQTKKTQLAEREANDRYDRKEAERRKKNPNLVYMNGDETNRNAAAVQFGIMAQKEKINNYREAQKERGWLPNLIDDTMDKGRKTSALLRETKGIDEMLGDAASDMQDKKKKSKNGFLDKMLQAGSLTDKFGVITSSLDELTKKPAEMLTHVLEKADEHLYTLLYGADSDTRDEKGRDIKGFIDMAMYQMRKTFSRFNTWLDESILDPMREKLGIESMGDLWGKGLSLFGLDSKKLGEDMHKFFLDKDTGILTSTTNAIKNTFKGAFDTVGDSLKSTFAPLIDTFKGKFPKKEEKKKEDDSNTYYETKAADGSVVKEKKSAMQIQIDKVSGVDNESDLINNHKSNVEQYKNLQFDRNSKSDLLTRIANFEENINNEATVKFIKDKAGIKSELLNNDKDFKKIEELIKKIPAKNKDKNIIIQRFNKLKAQYNDYRKAKLILQGNSPELVDKVTGFDDIQQSFMDKITKQGISSGGISNKKDLSAVKDKIDGLDDEKYKYRKFKLLQEFGSFTGEFDDHIKDKASLAKTKGKSILSKGKLNVNQGENAIQSNILKKTVKEVMAESADTIAPFVPIGNQTNNLLTTIQGTLKDILNNIKANNTIKDTIGAIGSHATGARFIKKSGLTAISAGEMIIPSEMNPFNPNKDKVNKKKEIQNERNIKSKFAGSLADQIYSSIRENAEGDQLIGQDVKAKEDNLAVQGVKKLVAGAKYTTMQLFNEGDGEAMKKAGADVVNNIQQYAPNAIAGGLLGGTVGLVTGMVGGPLLAAAAGAAISIAKNSSKVQDWLFGKSVEDNDGNKSRVGGVVSKQVQDVVTKYLPDVKKFGLSGAVLGFLTPFGPIGGLMMGSALAYAKNNERLSGALFGDADGLLNKDRREAIQKAYPNIAAGVIAGLFMGPFGLLGNAVLGSGLGFLSSTSEFKDVLFGEEVDGKRNGGIVGAIKLNVVQPLADFAKTFKDKMLTFIEDDMIAPLKSAVAPIGNTVKHLLGVAFSTIPNTLNYIFERSLGVPMETFIKEQLIEPSTKFIAGALNIATKPIKAIVSAPFKAIGAVGNSLRAGQINKGRADYMTAEERLQFRNDHPVRGIMTKLNPLKKDRYIEDDENIANMNLDQVTRASDVLGQMKKGKNYFHDTKKQLTGQVAKEVSGYFNDNKKNMPIIGKGQRTRILQAIHDGDLAKAEKLISTLKGTDGKKLTPEQREALSKMLSNSTEELNDIKMRQDRSKTVRSSMHEQLAGLGLKNVTDKNLDKYINMFNKEKSSKPYEKQTAVEKDVADTIALGQKDQTEQIVGTLEETNKLLAMILSSSDESGNKHKDAGLTKTQIAERNKERAKVKKIADTYKTKAEKGNEKRFGELSKFYSEDELNPSKDKLLDNEDAFQLIKDRAKTGNKFDDISSVIKLDRKQLNRIKELSEFTKIPEKNLQMILGMSETQFGNVLDVSKNSKYSMFDEKDIEGKMSSFRGNKKLSKEEIAKLPPEMQELLKLDDKAYENKIRSQFDEKRVMDIANLKDGKTKFTDIGKTEPLNMRQRIAESITKKKDTFSNKAHIVKTDKDYINEFSNLGLLDTVVSVDDIKSMSSRQLDWILKDPKSAKKKIADFRKSKTLPTTDMNNVAQKASDAKKGIMTTIQDDGNPKDFIKDADGNMVEAQTANNKKIQQEENETKETNKGILGGLTTLATGFTGWFKAKKEEDEKEDKDPWWKKFLGAAGKIFLGATALGALPIIADKFETSIAPAVQTLWDEKMYPYYKANIEPKLLPIIERLTEMVDHLRNIPSKIGQFFTDTAVPWFKGEGQFKNNGFPYIFENHIVPFYTDGINFLFEKVAPTIAEALVKSTPAIIAGVLSGVGQLLGWDVNKKFGGQNTTKYNPQEVDEDGNFIRVKKDDKIAPVAMDGKESLAESVLGATGRSFLTGGAAGAGVQSIAKKGIIPKIARVITSPLKLIPGVGPAIGGLGKLTSGTAKGITTMGELGNKFLYKGGAKAVAEEAERVAIETAAKEAAEKLAKEEAKKAFTKRTGKRVSSRTTKKTLQEAAKKKTLSEVAEKATVELTEKATTEVAEKGLGKLVKDFMEKGLRSLCESKAVKNVIVDSLKHAGKEFGEKVVKKIVKTLSESLAGKLIKKALSGLAKASIKVAARVGSTVSTGGIAAAIFAGADFASGMINAKNILGITEAPSFVERLTSGLIKAVNGFFALGLIPENFIVGVIVDTVGPALGLDLTAIQDKRAAAEEEVSIYNAQQGTSFSVEEYNNKDKFSTKIKAKTKAGFNNITEKISTGIENIKESPMAKSVANIGSYITECIKVISANTGEEETTIAIAEDDPLKGIKKAIHFGIKMAYLPSNILKAIGKKILDYGKKTWDGLSNIGSDIAKTASGMMKGALEGDLSKSIGLDFAPTYGDNLLANTLSNVGISITKIVVAPFAIVTKVISDAVRGIQTIWESVKTVGSNVAGAFSSMIAGVKEGDYSKAVGMNYEVPKTGDIITDGLSLAGVSITRLFLAGPALLGTAVGKVASYFSPVLDGLKVVGSGVTTGAQSMFNAAIKGDYSTIFTLPVDDESQPGFVNGLAKLTNIITKVALAPIAIGLAPIGILYSGIKRMMDPPKVDDSIDEEILKKAGNGEISVFGKEYWAPNNNKDDSPMSQMQQIGSFIKKLVNAPIILIKGTFSNIIKGFTDVVDWVEKQIEKLPNFLGIKDYLNGYVKDDESSKAANEFGRGHSANRYGRGSNHLSQLDPAYSMSYNAKGDTVKQTMADSGCGPVAAATAVNRAMGQQVDPRDMANYSLKNGFKEKDGGTKPQFFNSAFGKYGIDSENMTNQQDIKNNLKSGNPVVLMGKDASGNGTTPYGKSPHYVVATGLDKNNNITVQNPESRKANDVYKASNILNKSTIGIAAKSKYGMGSMAKYGRGSDIVDQAANILSANEGAYGSVNPNDNGAISVGKVQWHADRAKNLLKAIIAANPQQANRILSPSLYASIVGSSSWKNKIVGGSIKSKSGDAYAISLLLSSPEGMAAQDRLTDIDITGYINHGKSLGITDSKALIYFADIENQGGRGGSARIAKMAAQTVGSYSKITLADIHRAAMSDSVFRKYSSRRNQTYKACGGVGSISTSTGMMSNVTTSVSGAISNAGSSMYNILDNIFSSMNNVSDGIINPLYNSMNSMFSGVFGSTNGDLLKNVTGESASSETEIASTEETAEYGAGTGNYKAPKIQNQIYKTPSTKSANKININNSNRSSSNSRYGMGDQQLDYSAFISTIIEILLTIAGNTDKLSQIVELLSENLGVDLKSSDKNENKQTTINRLKKKLMSTLGSKNGLGSTFMNKDTGYILDAMTSIAQQ